MNTKTEEAPLSQTLTSSDVTATVVTVDAHGSSATAGSLVTLGPLLIGSVTVPDPSTVRRVRVVRIIVVVVVEVNVKVGLGVT